MDIEKLFCLSSSVQVLPFDVTTPRDSYAWKYRELGTLFNLSKSLTESRFEPLDLCAIILPLSDPNTRGQLECNPGEKYAGSDGREECTAVTRS